MKDILIHKIFILLLCLISPAFYFACSAEGDFLNPGESDPFDIGRQLLRDHDVTGANEFYTAKYKLNPSSGDAAVGFAFTSFLLLPYHPSVTALIKHIGGSRPLNANRDIIFERNGLISLLAQGTPFEDQGEFSGISSLLLPDLPWTDTQIDDPDFLGTIPTELNTIADDLIAVSDALVPIIDAMEGAVKDRRFSRFEMPGEVFFNDNLTLSINRADLAFASSLLHGLRGAIRFIGAYDHPYKVSDFGEKWKTITPQDPDFKSGYEADDYLIEFIDARILRTIRNATHFALARKEARSMLENMRNALEIAKEEPRFGALSWNQGRSETIVKATTFLHALESSLDNPTQLPFITPTVTLDLSLLFEDGKTLDRQTPWLSRSDRPGDYFLNYTLNPEALDLFLNGVLSPSLSEIEDGDFQEADNFSELSSVLFGNINDDFNNSFGN